MANKKKAKSKKGGGGKLTRSEIVQVRLGPKLKFAAELAARKQRRSLSSYIEWAVENSLHDVSLGRNCQNNRTETAYEALDSVWDVDEADRFVFLASCFPHLLTHDEEVLAKLIQETGFLWKGKHNDSGEWIWRTDPKNLIFDRLRENWDLLKKVSKGEVSKDELPQVEKRNDIPF